MRRVPDSARLAIEAVVCADTGFLALSVGAFDKLLPSTEAIYKHNDAIL